MEEIKKILGKHIDTGNLTTLTKDNIADYQHRLLKIFQDMHGDWKPQDANQLFTIHANKFAELSRDLQSFIDLREQITNRDPNITQALTNVANRNLTYLCNDIINHSQLSVFLEGFYKFCCEGGFSGQIHALQTEFSEVFISQDCCSIGVITEPIELTYDSETNSSGRVIASERILEQVKFGRFILLFMNLDDEWKNWRVIPLEPNYPGNGDSVNSHPYVNRTTICLGDGSRVFSKRLESLELADCASIMHSVLTYYSPVNNSPYRRLIEWIGTGCSMCGNVVRANNSVKCHYDSHTMCKNCAKDNTCSICGHTICSRHYRGNKRRIYQCPICEKLVCGYCATSIKKHKCIDAELKKSMRFSRRNIIFYGMLQTDLDARKQLIQRGTEAQPKKRRGRKPKVKVAEQAEQVAPMPIAEPMVNVLTSAPQVFFAGDWSWKETQPTIIAEVRPVRIRTDNDDGGFAD